MATDIEWSYLAGMIDADGSVTLKQQSSGALDLTVQVYNVNEELMRWLAEKFGGHVRSEKRAKREHWRIRWVWDMGGSAAHDLLVTVGRYMIVKKAQASLGVEAWENRQPTPRGERAYGGLSSDVISLRRGYVDRMRNLNAVGGNGAKDIFVGAQPLFWRADCNDD